MQNFLCPITVTPELTPEQLESIKNKKSGGDIACHIHEYTYGINSEPLALVALTFAALIHDVDHRGVSNVQMMQEEPEMGERYREKSVAGTFRSLYGVILELYICFYSHYVFYFGH